MAGNRLARYRKRGMMPDQARGWVRRLWDWIWFRLSHLVAAIAVAVVIVLALAGGTVYAVHQLTQQPSLSCGSDGVRHPNRDSHECVGVTDGRYDFSPGLRRIDRRIRAENRRVGRGHGVVTIAVLLPMTGAGSTIARHALEGAYIAQYRANHLAREAPKLRLVLANPGTASRWWKPVAGQLDRMTGAPDNLRAVVGVSVSTGTTKAEIAWLTGHGVPVVTNTTTAEDIANPSDNDRRYPGLARVAPTNLDEAHALSHVNDVDPKRALLVTDTQPDDDYIASLTRVFRRATRGAPYQPVPFTRDSALNQFAQNTRTICQLDPRYIYFAGRRIQLRQFLNELGKNCPTSAFTVLTGSDAAHLANDPKLDRSVFGPDRITLEYAALATPRTWTGAASAHNARFAAGYRAFQDAAGRAFAGGGRPSLDDLADGEALMTHDAVWTARQALVLLIGVQRDSAGRLPSTGDVADEWKQLRGRSKVEGASGWICLDNGGNPWNKAVPIMRLNGNGQQFRQLAWPDGKPPGSVCSA